MRKALPMQKPNESPQESFLSQFGQMSIGTSFAIGIVGKETYDRNGVYDQN